MFLACGVLLGLVGCGNEEVVPDDPNKGNDNPSTVVGDDGMDFDENDVILQETETNGFMLASHEQIKEFAKTGNFLHYDSIKRVFE